MMNDSVWGAIDYWYTRATEALERAKDRVAMEAAHRLPRRVVKWAIVRATAEATTGAFALMEASVTALQVLRAWEAPDGEHPCGGCRACEVGSQPIPRVIVFAGPEVEPEDDEVFH